MKILEQSSILYIDVCSPATLFMKLVVRLLKSLHIPAFHLTQVGLRRCFEIPLHSFQEKWARLFLFLYFILVYEVLWNNHKIFLLGFQQLE